MKHVACRVSVLLFLVVVNAVAAVDSGTIRGRVTDESKNVLPGASVYVNPSGVTVVTDREGNFTLNDVTPGAYKLVVSYLGFIPETADVNVALNHPVVVEVRLNRAPNINEEITVTASRSRGEVEALNQRKTALDIVDVMPAEVIKSLPNANVAEALARVPSVSVERDEGEPKFVQVRGLEPRFTSVTINGVLIPSTQPGVRQIKLDAFPSDLVGSIELHKTASADQEGDAIGGSVNLVTKIAGDEPSLTASVDGGYASLQGGRPSSRVESTYMNRFGEDHALGIVFGGTYDYNGRAINDIEPGPAVVTLPNGTLLNTFTGTDYRDYRYERKRFGFAGGMDYRLPDGGAFHVRGFLAQFENYGDRWVRSVAAGNFITPTTTDDSGGFSANVQHRTPNEQTYSLNAGGSHQLGIAVVDYDLGYSRARQNSIDYRTADFNGPSAAIAVDARNPYFPAFNPIGNVNQTDPTQYTLSDIQISNGRSTTPAFSLAANGVLPTAFGAVKIGAKYRSEDKKNVSFSQYFNATGSPVFSMSNGMASFSDSSYYFGRYPEGPNASLAAVNAFFQANPGAFVEDVNKEHLRNDPNNFDATERVAAAYAKVTRTFGAIDLDAGARVERTSSHYDAFIINKDAVGNWASTDPTSGSANYTNVLPSISLKYNVNANTDFRAAYGWTVGRPDYSLLVPTLVESDTRKQLNAGNPNLKPTRAQNLDLLFEHFLSSVGVVAAGTFYKDLTDPIYPGSATQLPDGFTQIQPINGPKAKIYGFEVAWQQHFGFLPGVLSGLGVDANYTHTDSKAVFDPSTGRSGSARLQRTTPNAANFGLTYDKGSFSMRAAATYNSATIFSYNYQDGADGGLHGPNGDTYLYPHTQIDAQASYAFRRGYEFFVSGLNLNNEVFGFYNGSRSWNIQREFYGRTYSAGFRVVR